MSKERDEVIPEDDMIFVGHRTQMRTDFKRSRLQYPGLLLGDVQVPGLHSFGAGSLAYPVDETILGIHCGAKMIVFGSAFAHPWLHCFLMVECRIQHHLHHIHCCAKGGICILVRCRVCFVHIAYDIAFWPSVNFITAALLPSTNDSEKAPKVSRKQEIGRAYQASLLLSTLRPKHALLFPPYHE